MNTKIRKLLAAFLDVFVPGTIIILIFQLLGIFFGIPTYSDYVVGSVWGVILVKDIFAGQSISKKLLGVKIVNANNSERIKPFQSILRNFIVLPVLPLEILFYILFGRRIGDLVCSTKVVETTKTSFKEIRQDLLNVFWLDYVKYYIVGVVMAIIGFNIYTELIYQFASLIRK